MISLDMAERLAKRAAKEMEQSVKTENKKEEQINLMYKNRKKQK